MSSSPSASDAQSGASSTGAGVAAGPATPRKRGRPPGRKKSTAATPAAQHSPSQASVMPTTPAQQPQTQTPTKARQRSASPADPIPSSPPLVPKSKREMVTGVDNAPLQLLYHTRAEYLRFDIEHAYDLCASRQPHALRELQELLAVRGMVWLNDVRNRPKESEEWSHVHRAAAESPAILQWLYENEAIMNQLTYSKHRDVEPGSTALHVAVQCQQFASVQYLLEVSDASFVNYRNVAKQTARDLVDQMSDEAMRTKFAAEFDAWERRMADPTLRSSDHDDETTEQLDAPHAENMSAAEPPSPSPNQSESTAESTPAKADANSDEVASHATPQANNTTANATSDKKSKSKGRPKAVEKKRRLSVSSSEAGAEDEDDANGVAAAPSESQEEDETPVNPAPKKPRKRASDKATAAADASASRSVKKAKAKAKARSPSDEEMQPEGEGEGSPAPASETKSEPAPAPAPANTPAPREQCRECLRDGFECSGKRKRSPKCARCALRGTVCDFTPLPDDVDDAATELFADSDVPPPSASIFDEEKQRAVEEERKAAKKAKRLARKRAKEAAAVVQDKSTREVVDLEASLSPPAEYAASTSENRDLSPSGSPSPPAAAVAETSAPMEKDAPAVNNTASLPSPAAASTALTVVADEPPSVDAASPALKPKSTKKQKKRTAPDAAAPTESETEPVVPLKKKQRQEAKATRALVAQVANDAADAQASPQPLQASPESRPSSSPVPNSNPLDLASPPSAPLTQPAGFFPSPPVTIIYQPMPSTSPPPRPLSTSASVSVSLPASTRYAAFYPPLHNPTPFSSMHEVLEYLSLTRYAPNFEAEEMTVPRLLLLAESDLTALLPTLGARKEMWNFITRAKQQQQQTMMPPPSFSPFPQLPLATSSLTRAKSDDSDGVIKAELPSPNSKETRRAKKRARAEASFDVPREQTVPADAMPALIAHATVLADALSSPPPPIASHTSAAASHAHTLLTATQSPLVAALSKKKKKKKRQSNETTLPTLEL